MIERVVPVILCGGSGTRLWPLSRTGFPKQFLCLTGKESLFQQAAARLSSFAAPDIAVANPIVVCNEEHRFLASEQLREIGIEPETLLLEPGGRNTAPALALASFKAMDQCEDPILVVTPADQTVADVPMYASAMRSAVRAAARGSIVVLGIAPDRPETGYGYIRAGASTADGAFAVDRFVEKPDLATAERYLAEGAYYWNAGIFVLRASRWTEALQRFCPAIASACQVAWHARAIDRNFTRPGREAFAAVPAESIDYAVMERCPGSEFPVEMIPLTVGWSDLGAWDAVWRTLPRNDAGNAHFGDVITTDTRNSLVHASSRLVSLVGVDNLVVVETADAVLVADRDRSQDVAALVARLKAEGRGERELHRKVHRPWGWYDEIDEGHRFKVKRIQVKPKASLSLQKHHHRAEHWIVVRGTAEITCGDRKVLLSENQSTYISLGEIHRLANPGAIPLEIIEVQSGAYLGEDDIVRIDDCYGRKGETGD